MYTELRAIVLAAVLVGPALAAPTARPGSKLLRLYNFLLMTLSTSVDPCI